MNRKKDSEMKKEMSRRAANKGQQKTEKERKDMETVKTLISVFNVRTLQSISFDIDVSLGDNDTC